ncbi:MAG: cytochrome c-type biogenesis protein CcmH [Plesiomonas shigelloides]
MTTSPARVISEIPATSTSAEKPQSSELNHTPKDIEIRFASPEQAERANQLAASLRCPSCQNQNLLESNSVLARDLRLEVFRRVAAGDSDDEIRRSLIARYGDFVTYRPPLQTSTLLLWGTPPLLLLIAAIRLFYRRKRKSLPPSATHLSQQTAKTPATSNSASSLSVLLVVVVVASAMLGVGSGYQRLGHWDAWRNWQANPDPLQHLDGAALRSAAGVRLHERINQDPRDKEAWAELAQWLLYQNRFDESLWAYERLAQLEGETSAATLAARATVMYYRDGQQMSAAVKRELAQALTQDPGEVTALMLLASDHFLNGRYREAAALWQQLLDEGRPRLNREAVTQALQTARALGGR